MFLMAHSVHSHLICTKIAQ